MPRPFAIDKAPSKIREMLIERASDSPGLSLDYHVFWLAEQGVKTSRSAVHRFLKANRHPVRQSPIQIADQEQGERSIRLGCLMVAANYALPGDKADLLKTAEDLLSWVEEKAAE